MKKKLKDVISKEFKGLWGTDFSDDGIPVIKTNYNKPKIWTKNSKNSEFAVL